ncbi:MAG: hypothetical protein GC201_02655 [Alphaproteobacteria bacterium]|nr:hypothetical protein [Alphaproteobacteria bacterium]
MLTPYDEFPAHQASRPFSHIPSTDSAWDDGYFFGLQGPSHGVFLFTGMRVSPNTDMIGGYAGICVGGRQVTSRHSRVWRPNFATAIGPLSYRFVEPFRDIHLVLEANGSPLSFDLHWLGSGPAYEEAHHVATNRGRTTTDQTRYTQAGTAEGWIAFDGRRYEVGPGSWGATRDHSWGIYDDRLPLKGLQQWLPPRETVARPRALRLWVPFRSRDYTGFYCFHEDADGNSGDLNDVFGNPFEGRVDFGWDRAVRFVSGRHDLEFHPGTRVMKRGTVTLEDEEGGVWRQELEAVGMPWCPYTIGYHQGSWKDGGTLATYHGEGVVAEWDELDVSQQPFELTPYGSPRSVKMQGFEYLLKIRSTDPRGRTVDATGQLELFIAGRYAPYGFEAEG